MRAKTEHMKIIDDYFNRFGYAINETIMPNLNSRKNWNYIEIGESENIGYGSVPSIYMRKLMKHVEEEQLFGIIMQIWETLV